MSRKRDIEAAVAAHNSSTAPNTLLLPTVAVHLLTVMFAEADVCRRSIASLLQEGFAKGTLRKLLNSLTAAGFVSKEMSRRGIVVTYRLHLPPQAQP